MLLLDIHPAEWGKRGAFPPSAGADPSLNADAAASLPSPPSFSTVFSQLIVFLNAFLLLSKLNRLAVIAAHPSTASYLYPPPPPSPSPSASSSSPSEHKYDDGESKEDPPRPKRPGILQGSAQSGADTSGLSALLHEQITAVVDRHPAPPSDAPSLLAGALSMGLCHINRAKRAAPKLRSRVLVVSASAESSASYVPLMNAIFSAHKLALPIDALVLHATDSLYLQQACSITQGLYAHPSPASQQSLLPLLLLTFLPDTLTRGHLVTGGQVEVDYRAVCFCHRKPVHQAMVCPVCLAVYCTATPRCPMCGSRFVSQLVQQRGSATGAAQANSVKKEEKVDKHDKDEKDEKHNSHT